MAEIKKTEILSVVKDYLDSLSDSGVITSAIAEKMVAKGILEDALYHATIRFAMVPDPSMLEYLQDEHDATPVTANPLVVAGVRQVDLPEDRYRDRDDGGIVYVLLDDVRKTPVFNRSLETFIGLSGSKYTSDHNDHTIDLKTGKLYSLADTEVKIGYITMPVHPVDLTDIEIDERYRNKIVELTVEILLSKFSINTVQEQGQVQE